LQLARLDNINKKTELLIIDFVIKQLVFFHLVSLVILVFNNISNRVSSNLTYLAGQLTQ